MEKKYDVLQVLKVMYGMRDQRRKSYYVILGFMVVITGCIAFLGFAILLTPSDIFAWLLYGTMVVGIVGGIFGIIWRVREAIKQIKSEQQDGSEILG